ncbi:MAG: hypothetical protein M3044_03980 [Thermoproteota archaeon]|nr:hypothetical protein [Thermoproteota archaeon]
MSRKTKAMLEHELNEIYRLSLDGITPEEIKRSRNISDRNYTKYMQKLRDQITTSHAPGIFFTGYRHNKRTSTSR